MRYHSLLVGLVLIASVACTSTSRDAAPSGDRGTTAEAEAMLARAIAHYEQVGRDQALADFTAKQPAFADRDLYVFCYGANRTIVGHGVDPALVGANFDDLRDVDGKAFGTEIWNVGRRPSGGTVEYRWMNPVSRQVEPKVSTVRSAGEDVSGVGVYRS
jgi:cytochrome c